MFKYFSRDVMWWGFFFDFNTLLFRRPVCVVNGLLVKVCARVEELTLDSSRCGQTRRNLDSPIVGFESSLNVFNWSHHVKLFFFSLSLLFLVFFRFLCRLIQQQQRFIQVIEFNVTCVFITTSVVFSLSLSLVQFTVSSSPPYWSGENETVCVCVCWLLFFDNNKNNVDFWVEQTSSVSGPMRESEREVIVCDSSNSKRMSGNRSLTLVGLTSTMPTSRPGEFAEEAGVFM